jgi:hypothetical protein
MILRIAIATELTFQTELLDLGVSIGAIPFRNVLWELNLSSRPSGPMVEGRKGAIKSHVKSFVQMF